MPQAEAEFAVPAQIGDYTDFYTSVHHATNVGKLLRPDNPLLPNYAWVPIGYHGRASSVGIEGRVKRPVGQTRSSEGPPHHGRDHGDGLEWEDLMPEINREADPSNMIWQLIDRQSGAENGAISWAFTVGDRVKIRLVNEMDSDHPMHHPFHIHGAGRFLILSRDGQPEANLVWKDTVLVRAGQTVDILLDVTNPGLWMAHCHIAEHTESGMMFSFEVARQPKPAR